MTSPNDTLLNETQRELLLNASQREDGAMSRPAGMKAATARKLASDLIEKKLAREVQAKAGAPVWRRDAETGRDSALIMTKRARSLLDGQDRKTAPASIASDIATQHEESASPRNAGPRSDCDARRPEPAATPISIPRSGTKLAVLIALLDRESGAGIDELIAATGWLPHTVRAALTSLRKRGFDVRRERGAKGSVYSIAGAPTSALAA